MGKHKTNLFTSLTDFQWLNSLTLLVSLDPDSGPLPSGDLGLLPPLAPLTLIPTVLPTALVSLAPLLPVPPSLDLPITDGAGMVDSAEVMEVLVASMVATVPVTLATTDSTVPLLEAILDMVAIPITVDTTATLMLDTLVTMASMAVMEVTALVLTTVAILPVQPFPTLDSGGPMLASAPPSSYDETNELKLR